MDRDYVQLMEDLRNGKIDSFTIEPDEFQTFQVQYHSYEFRQQIIGTAKRGGTLEYHLKQ
ncbi:hypothetical protein ABTQ33_03995 [Paucilactobacillus suebicus]|uniref:Uncharacterized protein n=1 Tax=Paucilactobacillus suebicus DSM 5007 = KCTC 3549 TaxID=1423807 RepID=A0A0R1W3D2_9LACO|nr:hypothetical protein FD16_GL001556 [Paucilactobacillus suebicus DSM 5007 = KCTC 3549]